MIYNKIVLDYFFSPAHIGSLDVEQDYVVAYKSSQKDQGSMELYLKGTQDGLIEQACFRCNDNPYAIAGLEWLCRALEGSVISALPPIDYHVLIQELGIPVVHYPVALRLIDVYQEVSGLLKKKYL